MAKKGLLSRKGRAGDWFRVGVFSATVIAPLVARWNDLRMAERARQIGKVADDQTRDLRQLAVEQARELSELATQRSQEWTELALARSNEWRDLAAGRASEWGGIAAARARALGDQASTLSEDLVALAAGRADDLRGQAVGRLEDARKQFLATKTYDVLKDAVPVVAKLDNRPRRNATALWIAGVVAGVLAAGAVAFVVVRRRLAAGVNEPLVELPSNGRAATAGTTGMNGMGAQRASRGGQPAGAISGLRSTAEKYGVQSIRDIDNAQTAKVAPIVGNIHTKVYHDASQVNSLPSEENRVYFANEEEARAAGFHPSHPTAAEHNESTTTLS